MKGSKLLNPVALYQLLRYMGPKWVAYRALHAWRVRSGALTRRTPVGRWQDVPVLAESELALSFIRNAGDPSWQKEIQRYDGPRSQVVEEAESVLAGEFRLFSCHKRQLGFPPDWHVNAFDGRRISPDRHWSQIHDFSSGDIKGVWECSRFSWAFALGRAFARTGDERYAEAFWQLFENWLDANPPNAGPQWRCGQEATFRLMAASWGRQLFSSSPSTSAERLLRWRQFVYQTGRRIDGHLDFALSQSNNHGISECVGLVTAARILSSAPEAAAWIERGTSELLRQVRNLVYADGSFAQHSTVYHRLMLHDLIWYLCLTRANGDAPADALTRAAARATRFLHNLMDEPSGEVPLTGDNDGSNILPLANADYLDFRPIVQLASSVVDGRRVLGPGPWDEAVGWLAPTPSEKTAPSLTTVRESEWHGREGGWWVVRRPTTQIVMRAPEKYMHRPAHADLLHIDLWWRGQAITRDAGSYSYNTAGHFAKGLAHTAVHNSVEVNGRSQMQKVSRFLVLPWPNAVISDTPRGSMTAQHDAYASIGVTHRRVVQSDEAEGWVVDDTLYCRRPLQKTSVRLHWLLEDCDWQLDRDANRLVLGLKAGRYCIQWQANGPLAATVVVADPGSERGWWSPHYHEARSAISLSITVEQQTETRLRTLFGPEESAIFLA